MNAFKNPRLRHRGKAEILGLMMEINTEHIAYLLHTLSELYPKQFYRAACNSFILDYMDTVQEFDCGGDEELKDYKISQYLLEMPYITRDTPALIYSRYKDRPMNKQDAAIYNEPEFENLFAENILLMLIQLHYSNGFGQSRMMKIVENITWFEKPFEWLSKNIGIDFQTENEDVWNFLKEIDKSRKKERENVSTMREQLDARRELSALKAYQTAVMKL